MNPPAPESLDALVHDPGLEGLLAKGARNALVKALQVELNALGHDAGVPDGIYLGGTQAAVAELAQRHGVESDGTVVTAELLALVLREKAALAGASQTMTSSLEAVSAQLAPELLEQQPRDLYEVRALMGQLDGQLGRLDVANDWRDVKSLAHRLEVQGVLPRVVAESRVALSGLREVLLQRGLRNLIQAMSPRARLTAHALGEDVRRANALNDPAQRGKALQAVFESADRFMRAEGIEAGPNAITSWNRLRGALGRVDGRERLLTFLESAQRSFFPTALVALGHPDQVNAARGTMSAGFRRALSMLELDAGHSLGRPITAEMLSAMAPPLSRERAEALVPHLNAAMREANIQTPKQQAAFIAQLAHESARFSTFRERGDRAYFLRMYDPAPFHNESAEDARRRARRAAKLRNTQPGDGPLFRGRGAIQMTGRGNYTDASSALFPEERKRLLQKPELVEQPELAFRVAAWFWDAEGLNPPAEAGQFAETTQIINGGFNGWLDRLELYARALDVIGRASG